MLLRSLAALLVAGSLSFLPQAASAQEDQPLNPKQQEAVKKLVHDYIMENPSIIAEAIEALREKEQLSAENDAKKSIADRARDIFDNPASPVLGNPKGDVTIVEFFDYRCPYCKTMSDALFEIVKADGKVKLVMKDLPVLGPDSVLAARAALAARNQKKYEEFHKAMMHLKGPLNEQTILKTAAEAGLSAEKLKKDMEDQQIDKAIDDNLQLAHALGVNGTPAFIVGDQLIPGAMPPAALKQLIDQARKPKS
jgi:protein-disulfide isomerase